ncbi:hypothetical protein CHEID_07120 [Corynebacterium heidelbergense]|nr:hypothetical protein CHEID_07120 [Corynebacterium heidelbergense]
MGRRRQLWAAMFTTGVTGMALIGCANSEAPKAPPAPQTTTVTASSSVTMGSAAAGEPAPTLGQEDAAEPPKEPEGPIGFTEAPGQAQPSAMNKTIARCGEPGMYQRGTTFFTDGTSGWTVQCANQPGS